MKSFETARERVCPLCGRAYREHPALSRKDNETPICPDCGVREAVEEEEIDFDRYESYLHMYESLKERSPQWARTKFRKNKQ